MAEITDPEIDVESLMAEIREAVAEREAEGKMSLGSASVELRRMLLNAVEFSEPEHEIPTVRLQPEFEPHKDDHYQLADLLKFHDHTFVRNAYRAILKREPGENEPGQMEFREELRSGRLNKIDVLASIRSSGEGRRKGVRVDGLARPAAIRRLYRVPVFGYLFELLGAVARLPRSLRSQRQFETHALAQQQLLADHINQLSHVTLRVSESLSSEVTEVSSEQRSFARLQHHQIVALFNEQRELLERLNGLKDALDHRIAQMDGKTGTLAAADLPTRRELDEFFASFANEFRGDPKKVKEGLRFYLPVLRSAGVNNEILDIGCGRGEWLDLLKDEGVQARGIEINSVLAEELRGRGFEIIEEDALAYLSAVPDRSLNAVTAFHFIEHLSFATFIALLEEIARTLKPGGVVIFETPNPKNLVVGACNFYSDPTHHKPFFPETLHFILSNRGFVDVRLEYVNSSGTSHFEGDSQSAEALRSWFDSPRDFAVIGRRARA